MRHEVQAKGALGILPNLSGNTNSPQISDDIWCRTHAFATPSKADPVLSHQVRNKVYSGLKPRLVQSGRLPFDLVGVADDT